MKLWLLRHPRPDVPEGLCYGATDVPIVQSHLQELLDHLPHRLPKQAVVWSSPLSRCLQLARALEAQGFAPARTDERLREMNFGDWEGRLWPELPREQIAAWRADIEHHVPPGGESVSMLAHRARAFVAELPADSEIILVTHAGVMQSLLRTLREQPLAKLASQKIDYGQVLLMERTQGTWRLDEAPGLGA